MSLTVAAHEIHPAAQGCIEALQWLHERRDFANILEIGSGSGILSAIAARIWQAPALATDISEQAVAATARLMADQGLRDWVTCLRSDGFRHPAIAGRAPYDLIIANLVAKTLISMVSDIQKHLAPEGIALVSGVLEWLAADAEAAFHAAGLKITSKTINLSWATYILCHSAAFPADVTKA